MLRLDPDSDALSLAHGIVCSALCICAYTVHCGWAAGKDLGCCPNILAHAKCDAVELDLIADLTCSVGCKVFYCPHGAQGDHTDMDESTHHGSLSS